MAETNLKGALDTQLQGETSQHGVFRIGQTVYEVTLSQSSLSWTKMGAAADSAVSVPVEEIVSVSSGVESAEVAFQSGGFSICYVTHMKKRILRRETVVFQPEENKGDPGVGEKWYKMIQGALDKVKERPHKLLVLVNPVSGGSNGKKIYETTAAEVFKEANIQTEVIVTEKAHHTEEILSAYDLSTVDGIALVGGDGLYHEAVNGLQQRLMKEAGLDENDSSASLQPVPIPVGLIPAGTGNGIAAGCYGTSDVETAALTIMIGKRKQNSIIGVHSQGELIGYSVLIVGYGWWGDMMYSSETRRHWGVMRYPAAILDSTLVKAQRHMDLTVEYLPPLMSKALDESNQPIKTAVTDLEKGDQSTATKETEVETLMEQMKTAVTYSCGPEPDYLLENKSMNTAKDPASKWERLQGIFSGACVTIGSLKNPHGDPSVPLEECTRLLLNHPCGRWWSLWFFVKLMAMEGRALLDPVCEHKLVKEFRIKLNNPSDTETEYGKLEHIINIDGEIYQLKTPEFIARLHPKLVQLYSSTTESWYDGCG